MQTTIVIIVIATVVSAAALAAGTLAFLYFKIRGTRVVTCPETGKRVAVELDARRAAMSAIIGETHFRLHDCTRWPERRNCGQECLAEIADAPNDCLVRTILQKWFAGKRCVMCREPIGEINWLAHDPALRDPTGGTMACHDVPAERIFDYFATHRPVCWNCHVAESFRREHPGLVVDRPEHDGESAHVAP
jgi:hypothetical protein